MKKQVLLLAVVFLLPLHIFAQGVEDKAVIPVSVTLNSIMRLNIVSGGNIEFVFNTLQDYNDGITTNSKYKTSFTVASSIDFRVQLIAEDDALYNTDETASVSTMPLNNVGYRVEITGDATNNSVSPDFSVPDDPAGLTNSAQEIVTSVNNGNAGGVADNAFSIRWECGTQNSTGTPAMNGNSLLDQSIPAGRYSTTVFLNLIPN